MARKNGKVYDATQQILLGIREDLRSGFAGVSERVEAVEHKLTAVERQIISMRQELHEDTVRRMNMLRAEFAARQKMTDHRLAALEKRKA